VICMRPPARSLTCLRAESAIYMPRARLLSWLAFTLRSRVSSYFIGGPVDRVSWRDLNDARTSAAGDRGPEGWLVAHLFPVPETLYGARTSQRNGC
jgi:hypothetical protein